MGGYEPTNVTGDTTLRMCTSMYMMYSMFSADPFPKPSIAVSKRNSSLEKYHCHNCQVASKSAPFQVWIGLCSPIQS